MKKKTKVLVLILVVISFSVIQLLRIHDVTIYLVAATARTEKQYVELLVDNKLLFKDTLINQMHIPKVFHAKMSGGLHSIQVFSNGEEISETPNFFVFFNQHLVVEYFAECDNQNPCFVIRNRLLPFYID
jgi:hypothetical protein